MNSIPYILYIGLSKLTCKGVLAVHDMRMTYLEDFYLRL